MPARNREPRRRTAEQRRRTNARRCRTRRRNADAGWTPEMDALLKLLQPACVACGSREHLCVDHVVPVCRGGKLLPGNAAVLCRPCNVKKGGATPKQLPRVVGARAAWCIMLAAESFRVSWGLEAFRRAYRGDQGEQGEGPGAA